MEGKTLKQIRILQGYCIFLTLIVIYLAVAPMRKELPDEIAVNELTVHRINVVEQNGALKMVISNKERQHPGMIDNKDIPAREREAGMIFFNSAGDECGGLIYDGGTKNSAFALSVDQFRNDQVLQLQYGQDGFGDSAKRHYGLRLWERSDKFTLKDKVHLVDSLKGLKQEGELEKQIKGLESQGLLGAERMFVGKNNDGDVGLFIRDNKGNIRIKLYCDRDNNPKMIFMDEKGQVSN